MSKNFNYYRQMALGYILIVGLGLGLITPMVHAEAPTDTLYAASTKSALVDGMTQEERAAKIDAFYTVRGNLPLAGHGMTFVRAADKYGVDWRLAAAFAYNESTAGAQECRPKNGVKTYNAFGYEGCKHVFASYDDAIDTVTRNIAGEIASTSKYYDGKTIEQIIDAYNPPSANPKYRSLVLWTMKKIASTDTKVLVAADSKSSSNELALK